MEKYPWLVKAGEGMQCWVCVKHAPEGKRHYSFIGRPAICQREDTIKKHQDTETHEEAWNRELMKRAGMKILFCTFWNLVPMLHD